jgi:acyl-CoA thioester hydrolase
VAFSVRIAVRGYELDTQGHLNSAVYHQYAEHARWEYLKAAGVTTDRLLASGVGPVQLEATIRFFHELRGGDEVDVTCEFAWGEGKTFTLSQRFVKPDGTVCTTLTSVGGLLDLTERRMIADPGAHLRGLADDPSIFGLEPTPAT